MLARKVLDSDPSEWFGVHGASCATPSPPTKSLGFGGFDSSKLLILRG